MNRIKLFERMRKDRTAKLHHTEALVNRLQEQLSALETKAQKENVAHINERNRLWVELGYGKKDT